MPLSSPRARSEVLKSLYVAMLLYFPLDWVLEFWSSHPFPGKNGESEDSDLFKSLWTEKITVPFTYLTSVLNDLEPFLVARNRCILEFLEFFYVGLNGGIFIPAKFVLGILNPFLGKFFSSRDLRFYLLSLSNRIGSYVFPGVKLHTLSLPSPPDWRHVIRAVDLRINDNPDTPILDFLLFYGSALKHYPLILSLPSFEDVSPLADCRTPDRVVTDPMEWKLKGREIGFHAFCRDVGFDPVKQGWPDSQVWLMTEDHYCPQRQRVVLREGCIYGAPVFLLKIRFLKNIQRPQNFLKDFVSAVLDSEESPQKKAEKLHRKLLLEADKKLQVVFHVKEVRITVNGKHLVSSAPARILRKLVHEFVTTGRTEFQHREFLHDENLISQPSNPNFIIRLIRLEKTLAEKCPDLSLTRPGRGKITFTCRRDIRFRES